MILDSNVRTIEIEYYTKCDPMEFLVTLKREFKLCSRNKMHFVLDIELQRNNSIQKRPVGQSMKKFQRNTGRILPNAEPVSIVSRSSSDALGGQGRMLDVWMLDVGFVIQESYVFVRLTLIGWILANRNI